MTAQTAGRSGALPVETLPAWQLARRERIVDAGLEVLSRLDYDEIQIRDVAETAKVARATLYRYFASKEHLYATVLIKWAQLEGFDAGFPPDSTPKERVRAWIQRVIGAIERKPQCFRALMALQDSSDPDAKALVADLSNEAVDRLAGLFETLGPDRAADTAVMLYAIVNTLAMRAIFHHGQMSEVYRIADRFIDSIASDLR